MKIFSSIKFLVKALVLAFFLFAACAENSFAQKENSSQESSEKDKAEKKATTVQSKPVSLFNGKDLKDWKIIKETFFDKHGDVKVEDGSIVVAAGNPATGFRYAKEVLKDEYELSLKAKRMEGSDFFCGLTFPIRDKYCSLIVGGWGGTVVGLSNVDDFSAVENQTTDFLDAKKNQWYHIRLRVAEGTVKVWIDKKKFIDLAIDDHEFDIWWEQEPVRPLGFATWHTKAAFKEITLTNLKSKQTDSKKTGSEKDPMKK